MKFSKQLLLRASPLWYDHYVDYKSLKGTLKSFRVGDSTDPKSHTDVPAAERKPTPPPNMAAIDEFTNTFSELLKVEADKVEGWYVIKETEGRARLAELVARGKSPQVNREVWLKDIEDLIANLEMLFEYSEVNIVAFKKIIKKFQKYIEHGNVSNVWTVIKAYRFFSNSELDQLDLDALPGGQISKLWLAVYEGDRKPDPNP
ncbi:uncharacterized protein BJ171DRAFT_607522, partial [Polychytrium aggregatum]|uniref:uncharacterized protein n=1 Tax=Polychytrium aggregatum TaxID=110093 RepID=UPI0022FF1A46